MWTSIVSAGTSVVKVFADLASVVLKYMGIILAYRVGKRAAQNEAQEDTLEVKSEQLKIANRAKLRRDDILSRMRKRSRND